MDLNHYLTLADITRSIVFGTESTALCGERFTPEATPGHEGSVASPDLPICPACEAIYQLLPVEEESVEEVTV